MPLIFALGIPDVNQPDCLGIWPLPTISVLAIRGIVFGLVCVFPIPLFPGRVT
jgi:hypothetical protein